MDPLIRPEVLAYAEAHSTPPPNPIWPPWTSRRAGVPGLGDDGGAPGRPLPRAAWSSPPRPPASGDRDVHRLFVHRHGRGPPRRTAPSSRSRSIPSRQAARGNIAAAGYESRISVIEGPALRSLDELQGPYDFVFIDADKVSYDAYFEAVLPKLSPHGLIVVDNTLQPAPCSPRLTNPTRRPGAARLQRQGGRRPAGGLRAHHHPRRRDPDPPGRLASGRGPGACSTTTSTSGRTRSTRRRCDWSSWPPTASAPRRPG